MSGERKRESHRIPLDLASLSGRVDIFRVTRTLKRDPAVEAWLDDEPIDLRSIARQWFVKMRSCGKNVREAMHDGCPIACVKDAPFAYVNTFKTHVSVGFFYGAFINDPARLLEGSGKRMRHVKLRPSHEVNVAALNDLIVAAYADIQSRDG
jgi:hypothetical protein